MRRRAWVGIDVGKTSHHACAIDEVGKVVWNQKVSNEQRAIEQLVTGACKGAEQVRWAIDLTSPMALMLITVLLCAEQSVVYVPGRTVNTMRHAFRGEGKTDAKDARVIAETVRLRNDLSNAVLPDELVVELTQLTGYRVQQAAIDNVHYFYSLSLADRRAYSEEMMTNFADPMTASWPNWAKIFFNNKGVAAKETDHCADYPPDDQSVWD